MEKNKKEIVLKTLSIQQVYNALENDKGIVHITKNDEIILISADEIREIIREATYNMCLKDEDFHF